MDEKDFVPYETAKKLKAAGYSYPIHGVRLFKNAQFVSDAKRRIPCAPLIPLWQAMRWLREVKGIDITISVYREIDETVSPRIIKRSYECEITTEDDEDYIPYSEDEKNFPSYEAALSAGIDAALDLITNKTEEI